MPTDKDLLHKIQEYEERSRYLRYGFERDFYRNLLYKQGHQWIVWDEVARRFRVKRLKPWIPTPVTNKFSSVLDTLASLLLRVEANHQWSPENPNDEKQKAQAEVATAVLSHVKDLVHYNILRQELATWLVYTGNGWLVSSYDPTGGTPFQVPLLQCQLCTHKALPTDFQPACPSCGNTEGHIYAIRPDGTVEEETITGGTILTEVASPFEMFIDFTIPTWHFQRSALRLKQRRLDYFAARYGDRGKGVEAEAGASGSLSEFYQSTLPYLASGTGVSSSAALASRPPAAVEYTYWELPSDDHPDGLYVVATKTTVLEKGPLPSRNLRGEPILPINHFIFDPIPGSAMGKTIANDLAPKQRQRNELESLIQLITTRMANPVWIVPYGVDVEAFSGQPGAVLKVYQTGPGTSQDPRRIPGENVPSSVMAWLEKIDKDMEEVASVYDVLKGGAPPGITAGYALQLLNERGQSRWGPLFQRWENGWIGWAEVVTGLVRDYMPAEHIRKLLGPAAQWDLSLFKDEPLDRIAIRLEPASIKPRSELQEQALLDTWIQRGLINPADPATRALILRSVGLSKYDVHSDWDMKDAAKEEESFLQVATTTPLTPETLMTAVRFRPQIDNNMIHLWSHRQFAKSDRFATLPPEWQQVWQSHIEQTAMRVLQEQGMGAPSAAPSPAPAQQRPVAPFGGPGGQPHDTQGVGLPQPPTPG